MTRTTTPEPDDESLPRTRGVPRLPSFRAAGWLLLCLWALAATTAQVVGHSEAPAEDLRSALRSGEVARVAVDLDPWSARAWRGPEDYSSRSVVVEWRDGWRLHRTTLTEYSTQERADRARERARKRYDPTNPAPGRTPAAVVAAPVGEWLGSFGTEVVAKDLPSGSFSIGSLYLPGWLFGWLLGVTVGTYAMVGLNAQPWRATSWAWTWIVLFVPPLGVPAYLVLGGPAGLFPPRTPHRPRLTGGWAFLLVCLVLVPVTSGLLGGG